MDRFTIGPFECRWDHTTYNYDGTIDRGHPTLYMFFNSVMPFRTVAMARGDQLTDGKAVAAQIAGSMISGWLGEVGKFKTENNL